MNRCWRPTGHHPYAPSTVLLSTWPSKRLRQPQLPSSESRWAHCSQPAHEGGITVRWRDSTGTNPDGDTGGSSSHRALGRNFVHNDSESCYSKGLTLLPTEHRGLGDEPTCVWGRMTGGSRWRWGPQEAPANQQLDT